MKKILLIILFVTSGVSHSQDKFVKEAIDFTVSSFTLQGVYVKNLSDYKSIFPDSYGAYLTYSKLFKSRFSFDVRVGYLKQGTTDSTKDFSSSMIPVHVGGRYYFTNTKIKPYVSFMNGINVIIEDIGTNSVLDTNSGVRARYAFQVGTGLKVFFSKQFFFDINANYNNSFYHPNAMLTGFEYNAGVGIILKK